MTRDARGFTLLEILVALAVLGMLLAALASGTRFGLAAWSHQARATASSGDIDTVDRTLRMLAARIDPTTHRNEAAPVEGTAATLTIRTEMPEPAGDLPTDRATVTLGVDAAHRLVLRYLPYVNWIGAAPSARESVLCDGVDHVELGYWRPRQGTTPEGWATEWRARTNPALIRLRIVFAAADRRWPDIVVALMRQRPFGPA